MGWTQALNGQLSPEASPAALPEVVIVGRPNVGKSTLFNRLARRRQAIVHPEPGVTRDRLAAEAEWRGRTFRIVDTGGLADPEALRGHSRPGGGVEAAVSEQVRRAVEAASLVLLVVDARAGLTPHDRQLAEEIRRTGRPAMVVANKVDHGGLEAAAYEFTALGLGDVVAVSAATGRNMPELLDRVAERLAPAPASPPAEPAVRLAIIGRPNVGKSSLVNAIVGEPRVAVHHEPGTTRDAVDVEIGYEGRRVVLVDTAGIRRKARAGAGDLEQLAVSRALSAMRRADVAILVMDAASGITFQDARLADRAARGGLGVVLAVNKWDLVRPDAAPGDRWADEVRRAAAGLSWAPVFFISAAKGWRVADLLDEALEVARRRAARLPHHLVSGAVQEAQARRPPPSAGGRRVRIVGARQVGVAPPAIALELKGADRLDTAYCRYLESQFRRRLDLVGTPLRLTFAPAAEGRRALRSGPS